MQLAVNLAVTSLSQMGENAILPVAIGELLIWRK